jgi:hypothetical protein
MKEMTKEKLEVVRGSGNVFRDLGHANADAEQFKAILAAEIIKTLDPRRSTRSGSRCAPRTPGRVSTQPISRASATQTSGGSLWIAS